MTDIEWVEESDWGKVAVRDRVRFILNGAVLEGRAFRGSHDPEGDSMRVELWASSPTFGYLKGQGFTLCVEAKPAVELPSGSHASKSPHANTRKTATGVCSLPTTVDKRTYYFGMTRSTHNHRIQRQEQIMAEIQLTLHGGFRCDKRGCGTIFAMPEVPFWDGWRDRREAVLRAGWERREPAGRGAHRYFCPAHAERPGEAWSPGQEKRDRSDAYWARRESHDSGSAS